jgi:hypothetical protein
VERGEQGVESGERGAENGEQGAANRSVLIRITSLSSTIAYFKKSINQMN